MKRCVLDYWEKAKFLIRLINIFTTVSILRLFAKVFPHPVVSLRRIPLRQSLPIERILFRRYHFTGTKKLYSNQWSADIKTFF